jgi:hypothetical protein
MPAVASTLLQAPLAQSGEWSALLVAITVVGELLAILFVYRVLVRGGSPASTLLWIAVILAAPWLGLLLYYLFPRRLQLRRLRRVRVRRAKLRGARSRSGRGPCSRPARCFSCKIEFLYYRSKTVQACVCSHGTCRFVTIDAFKFTRPAQRAH